jgi:DnaK suppressor protein
MAVKKKAPKSKATVKKKTVAKKKTVKKAAPGKAAAKKATAKKTVKKAAPKKATAKKAAPKKAPARKTTRKKSTSQIGPVPGIAPYQAKKGEEYMNEKQSAHFNDILLAWKRGLMEEVDRTVATQESEFSMELRARDRERKLIKKIDESIRNLDNSEFGFCEACGVEIGIKRLEARPTATLCIDCKVIDEIREKQMG